MMEAAGHKEPSNFWAKVWLGVGVFLTAGVIWIVIAELSRFGDMPPFTIRPAEHDGLSLPETGDFIGGWANLLAMIWLVVVTVLQYISLNTQQAELRDTRAELKETRKEIAKQVELMAAQRTLAEQQVEVMAAQAELANTQAKTSVGMLDLERKRTAVDFVLKVRPMLRDLLQEALTSRNPGIRSEIVGIYTVQTLIRKFIPYLEAGMKPNKEHELTAVVEEADAFMDLFDSFESYAEAIPDFPMVKGLRSLKAHHGFYDLCQKVQEEFHKRSA